MEITCTRCHQAVLAENCYCPACGLPQLVYSAETPSGPEQADRWTEAVRDASSVDWKPAMRLAMMLAVPAGLLSSGVSPAGDFGLFWMATAATSTVILYMRSQRPAWITIGAGARIGLVTGLLAAWMAFGLNGGALFFRRFVLHQSNQIDAEWKTAVDLYQQIMQQVGAGMNQSDAVQWQGVSSQFRAMMLSSWGHAGFVTFFFARNSLFLLFFAVAGGALGARLSARTRRPEV